MIPFLFLTYQATGKAFFWANVGGEILYWKTSPYKGEFGEWYQGAIIRKQEKIISLDSCGIEQLFANHSPYFEEMYQYGPLERNEKFNKKAKEQLSKYPEAYAKNTVASFSRLFFNFPFSYTYQKLSTLGFILSNMFFIVLCSLGLVLIPFRIKFIPSYIWLILAFGLAYIAVISLVYGMVRHLIPVIPVMTVFIAYTYGRLLEIKWSLGT